MPIFINWFEVDVSSTIQQLPARSFASWEESRAVHDELQLPVASSSRIAIRDQDVDGEKSNERAKTFLLGGFDTLPTGFSKEVIDFREHWQVCAKAVEYSMGQHLAARSLHIQWGKTAISATKPEFVVSEIGLCVEAGISFKAHYMRFHKKHGITLDWCVRQHFGAPLSEFASVFHDVLEGIPVLLLSDKQRVDPVISDYCGHYLGIVTKLEASDAIVLCRDGVKRKISRELLFPEARGDVVSRLATRMKTGGTSESLIRRIQVLAYALTTTNRRNLRIQQDKLKAAISFLNLDNRHSVNIDMQGFCSGRFSISSAPATARILQTQYV